MFVSEKACLCSGGVEKPIGLLLCILSAKPEPLPVESKKQIAEREAREKKEKAQELLRQREAQEAAENMGNFTS